jgi:hypothetical protein
MGGTAQVQGATGAGYQTIFYTAQVVGIYLYPYTTVSAMVYHQGRGNTAQGFGQHYRGAAMKQAVWLPGSVVYRHSSFKVIGAYFGKSKAQVLAHIALAQVGKVFYPKVFLVPYPGGIFIFAHGSIFRIQRINNRLG